MALFGKKKKKPAGINYLYSQAENHDGFKRVKLSSYGYKPAMNGVDALSGKDLSKAEIKITVIEDEYPRAVVSVKNHEVGTIFKRSFSNFDLIKKGKINQVYLVVEDGESHLFYKV